MKHYDSPVQQILDEDNNDPVVLKDDKGRSVRFEQVAVISIEEGDFVILHPLDPLEGVGEDEALVFQMYVGENGEAMDYVDDDETIDAVFEEYDRLYDGHPPAV